MPAMVIGRVYVKRMTDGGGTITFVITDGEQSLGYFLNPIHLPISEFVPIHLGGNFTIPGKAVPPIGVIQLGGPGINASIIVDEMELYTVD